MINIFGAYDARDLRATSIYDATEWRVAEAIAAFADQWNMGMGLWASALVEGFTIDVQSSYNVGYGGRIKKLLIGL